MKNYDFGEKQEEWSVKQSKNVPVWISPKYMEARKKAIEMLESETYGGVLTESDFWILMSETKSGKMGYTGLIISHNGCLKINDVLPAEKKFKPQCVTIDPDGFGKSLICTYCDPEQGLFEVGEVSGANCKNAYPYAMALKRLIDRVVLKNSKLAYAGIYSDSEADEFQNPSPGEEKSPEGMKIPEFAAAPEKGQETNDPILQKKEPHIPLAGFATPEQVKILSRVYDGPNLVKLLQARDLGSLDDMTAEDAFQLIEKLKKAGKVA